MNVGMVLSETSVNGAIVARIASALVLAPVALGLTIAGGWFFAGFVAVVACLMTYEWDRLTGGSGLSAGSALHAVILILSAVACQTGMISVAVICVTTGAVLGGSLAAFRGRSPAWAASGIVYVVVPSAALILLRALPDTGLGIVVWIFAVVWGTDIAAFFVGRLVGGPKLSRISPKKTWSGLAGGVLAAALLGAGVAHEFGLGSTSVAAAFGALSALIAQGGDLFESWMKRHFRVKDSSHMIPGHGGVLDRVDGLVPVAVAVGFAVWMVPKGY